jgi:cytochrome c-type biogenesis protein CcmH/NrfG
VKMEMAIAILTLLVLLWRFIDGFASKKSLTAWNTRIEQNIDQHRADAKKMIADQTETLSAGINEVLVQAKATNGRVSELEKWRIQEDAVKAYKAEAAGAPAHIKVLAGGRRAGAFRKAK